MNQAETNLIAIAQDGQYRVLREFTGEELLSGPEASDVLQAAVAMLRAGGRLTLSGGTFLLKTPLHLGDNTCLIGSGRTTRIVVADSNTDGVGITAKDSDGVELNNFLVCPERFLKGSTGILIEGCGGTRISGITSGGFRRFGIHVREQSFLTSVEACHFPGNGEAGLFLDTFMRDGRMGDYVPNLVSGCFVYGGGDGIVLSKAIVVNLLGCVVYQNSGAAYLLRQSNSISITGCRTFQITGAAVDAYQSHELNIAGNIFCWHTGAGIRINDCAWGTISANDVIDTSSWNSGKKDQDTHPDELPVNREQASAIELKRARGFTLGNNSIFNWEQGTRMLNGVDESADSYDNIITGNVVNYYEGQDIASSGKGSAVAANVSFRDRAYTGPPDIPFIQSFRTELTEGYIQKVLYGRHERSPSRRSDS